MRNLTQTPQILSKDNTKKLIYFIPLTYIWTLDDTFEVETFYHVFKCSIRIGYNSTTHI